MFDANLDNELQGLAGYQTPKLDIKGLVVYASNPKQLENIELLKACAADILKYNKERANSRKLKIKPIKKLTKDRGPCVICSNWTTHREPLKHEKWDNQWRESFICLDCLSSVGA